MYRSYSLIATVLLCAIILAAGCTQNSGPFTQVTPATLSSLPDLSSLALSPSDVPGGYLVNDSTTKKSGDMSKLALDLGWQGGFAIHFVKLSENPFNNSEILQSVAIYPSKSIANLLEYAEKSDQSDKDLVYTSLPSPGIGDYSYAFSGKANAQLIIKPEENNPLITGKSATTQTVMKQDFVEIVFSKGKTFEVIRMSGPEADYTILKGLAETAYRKIA
jgi:hypothetical protein